MKPYVRGKSIFFREINCDDAEFVLGLRTDPDKGKFLSLTVNDVAKQKEFITNYAQSKTDFYFIICDWNWNRVGTVRLYDIQGDSFSWGSWIKAENAPKNFAIESALLVYDFAFFSLHYPNVHFDVRKGNDRVIDFHKKFDATIVGEDELNFYFHYNLEAYLKIRQRYVRFLPTTEATTNENSPANR
jgi:RimJ/RimL family protein N-acetyltransferase